MKIPKLLGKTKKLVSSHKLVSVLLAILLLMLASSGWEKYKDWDNAQMIKGLARDFPLLIAEIEKETGLELDVQTSCMTTQEKFSEGVSTCEVLTTKNPASPEELQAQIVYFEQKQNVVKKHKPFMNEEGFDYLYRGLDSCSIRYQEFIYISCITAVRDANKSLAREEFSKIN